MIKAQEAVVGRIFNREIISQRGLSEFDPEFVLTEEWMGKLFGGDNAIALNDLHPIPLTAEWLERCGFTWQGGDHYSNETNDTWIEDKGGLYRFARPVLTMYNIQYVHQLQNLYFALTGEELTIKTKEGKDGRN